SFITTSSDTPGTLSITASTASAITATSVILKASANTGGTSIIGFFEWGTTSSLGNRTDIQSLQGGTGVTFVATLNNLQPNTQYYFRAVAQNSTGTVRGDVKTFSTTRVPSTAPEKINDVETGQIKSGYLIVTPDATSDAPTVTFTYGTISQGSVQSQAGIIPTM